MNKKLVKKILSFSTLALLVVNGLSLGVHTNATTFRSQVVTNQVNTLEAEAKTKVSTNQTNATQIGGFGQNWAGYSKTGSIYGAAGYFNVPDISLENGSIATYNAAGNYVNKAAISDWVGVGGFSSSALVQDGVTCSIDYNGNKSYYPWYEIVGVDGEYEPERILSDFTVKPGDKIYAYVTIFGETPGRTSDESCYNVAFGMRNITTQGENSRGFYKECTIYAPKTLCSSAEWITETPTSNNGLLHCPTFYSPGGTLTYNNGQYAHFENCQYQDTLNASFSQIWNSTDNLYSIYLKQHQWFNSSPRIVEVVPDSIGSTGNFNNLYASWEDR